MIFYYKVQRGFYISDERLAAATLNPPAYRPLNKLRKLMREKERVSKLPADEEWHRLHRKNERETRRLFPSGPPYGNVLRALEIAIESGLPNEAIVCLTDQDWRRFCGKKTAAATADWVAVPSGFLVTEMLR